jgi:hypothetical protein
MAAEQSKRVLIINKHLVSTETLALALALESADDNAGC